MLMIFLPVKDLGVLKWCIFSLKRVSTNKYLLFPVALKQTHKKQTLVFVVSLLLHCIPLDYMLAQGIKSGQGYYEQFS